MDKCEGFSACGGPLFAETRAALYDLDVRPKAINYVYGLGGRDIRVEDFEFVINELEDLVRTGDAGNLYRHLGQREEEVLK